MSRFDDAKARLIAAARRAASENSASRVSLRDIAKAANLSPAACYRYFPSRERLADAVAIEVCQEIAAAVRGASDAVTAHDDKLASAANAYLAYAVANRGPFELAFERGEGDWVGEERSASAMALADLFGTISGRTDLGPCLWAAVHGLVDLLLKGTLDIGQRDLGASVLRSRGEIVLRGLVDALLAPTPA